jgi:hypothetical protein
MGKVNNVGRIKPYEAQADIPVWFGHCEVRHNTGSQTQTRRSVVTDEFPPCYSITCISHWYPFLLLSITACIQRIPEV